MALTTTTTQTDRILAEVIAPTPLGAAYPNLVVSKLINYDMDFINEAATAKAYPRLADDGPGTTVAENADASTISTASLGTQLVNTPGEVYKRFDLTFATLENRMPGLSPDSLRAAINSNDYAALSALFAEEVGRGRKSLMESLEVDSFALLDDFSTTVGSTGVNITLSNTEQALYQMTKKETGAPERWVYVADPIHLSDLRQEIAITSGGMGGGAWTSDIQSILKLNPSLAVDGLQGALWGVPFYVGSNSVNPHPNAGEDEAWALFVRGVGHPTRGLPGAIACTFKQEFYVMFDPDKSARSCEVLCFQKYAIGERADDMGISGISDA